VEGFLGVMWVCLSIFLIGGTLWMTIVMLKSAWRKLTQ